MGAYPQRYVEFLKSFGTLIFVEEDFLANSICHPVSSSTTPNFYDH